MAIRTRRRAWLVKQHRISVYRPLRGVAGRAGDILVSAFEGECCLFMIEERWLPLVAVMATAAVVSAYAKLICMRILVALAASNGCRCEIDVDHRQFHVGRFVAVGAGRGAMRALQWELRLRVVEFRHVLPFLGGVAGLATQRLTLGA